MKIQVYKACFLSDHRVSGLASLLHILILLLHISVSGLHACVFPDYVQNMVNGVKDARDWRGQIKEQNKEMMLKYQFQNDIMQVISSDRNVKPYSHVCVQAYNNDKLLVAHEEEGQTSGRYTCIQILRRSSTVLQIKQAELRNNLAADLCADSGLVLNGWVIIDTKNVMTQRVDSPLTGGFNMQIYDKYYNKGVCDGNIGETRLESECLPGEDLNFYFRQTSCVPDGLYMYATQRTYCLSKWEDTDFTFMLIKHDALDYLWILRYPMLMETSGVFTAFLMKDLVATPDNPVTETNNYLSLSLTRQSPKMLDSLCFDDYEICSVLSDPCSYSENIARTCAKTCGFCSDTKPSVCQFLPPINGSWVDATQTENGPMVHINSTSVDIMGIETLHCLDWTDTGVSSVNNRQVTQQMLVTVSDNGCRPRFSCAKFTKMPSNTLFMHLSQTRLWPIVEYKEDNYDCSEFVYSTDKLNDRNPYRTKHSNLFIPHPSSQSVACDLSYFEYFKVVFRDGTSCSGHLTQSLDKDTVQFSLPQCSIQNFARRFKFLEYSNFTQASDKLLITTTEEVPPNVHCWVFSSQKNDTFHIIEPEQCNLNAQRRIRKGKLKPVATFTKDYTTHVDNNEQSINITTTVIPTHINQSDSIIINALSTLLMEASSTTSIYDSDSDMNNLKSSTSSSITEVSSSDKSDSLDSQTTTAVYSDSVSDNTSDDMSLIPDGNYTNSNNTYIYEGDHKDSSPIVVAAVIVTIIIIQIPVLCKCK